MSQLAQEKQVNLGTSARLNALSQYVQRISFSVTVYSGTDCSIRNTQLISSDLKCQMEYERPPLTSCNKLSIV